MTYSVNRYHELHTQIPNNLIDVKISRKGYSKQVKHKFIPPSSEKTLQISKTILKNRVNQHVFLNNMFFNLDQYNTVNLAIFWHRLAKNNYRWGMLFKDSRLTKVIEHTLDNLKECQGQELANITWAFFKMNCKCNCDIITTIKNITIDRLKNRHFFNIKELTSIIWSFAMMGSKDQELFNALKIAISDYLGENPDSFNDHALCNIVTSTAKIGCSDINFINALKEEVAYRLEHTPDIFIGKGLSGIVTAFHNLGIKDDLFFSNLKKIILKKIDHNGYISTMDLMHIAMSFITTHKEMVDPEFIIRILNTIALYISDKKNSQSCYEKFSQLNELLQHEAPHIKFKYAEKPYYEISELKIHDQERNPEEPLPSLEMLSLSSSNADDVVMTTVETRSTAVFIASSAAYAQDCPPRAVIYDPDKFRWIYP